MSSTLKTVGNGRGFETCGLETCGFETGYFETGACLPKQAERLAPLTLAPFFPRRTRAQRSHPHDSLDGRFVESAGTGGPCDRPQSQL